MDEQAGKARLEKITRDFPDKFAAEDRIFGNIHPGSRIFIGTACAELEKTNSILAYIRSSCRTA